MKQYAWFLLFSLLLTAIGAAAPSGAAQPVIVTAENASALERFAALEVRRYVYLRSGVLLSVTAALPDGDAVIVARKDAAPAQALRDDAAALDAQSFLVKTVDAPGGTRLYLVGGSDTAVLYAAYRFAELLGVRFYLHGDEMPDAQVAPELPQVDETHAPLFELRGIQPFHDFPEGPDWWNPEDYKAILAQLPKLRMNFFGLHTYPEDRPAAEPTVWIGRPSDIASDGSVTFAYSAIWYNTALPVGWGFQAKKTSDYACGAAALYDRDDYGSEVMRGLTPRPETPEQCIEVFARAGATFEDCFTFARTLGIKTCIGTETPLVAPRKVAERFGPGGTGLRAEGGKPAHFSAAIEGTDDDALYQSVRYDLDAYHCDVPQGAYDVTLHFVEPAYATAGARVFGVRIEGRQVVTSLDVFARVGQNHALDFTFDNIAVVDGRLDIEFTRETEFPCIAALAVEGAGVSYKVNCCGPAYKDYAGEDASSLTPQQIAQLYEGMFTRIMRTHPLDYYWFWTPENWTWEDVAEAQVEATINDIRIAHDTAQRLGAPFQLATCGWVLGPQYDRAYLAKALPPDMAVSCINRQVGHEPVEPGFADVQGRGKWAIPWLEDDPAMSSPQLWVGRMRRDARDALRYGCNGLMGIHWRTRILGPNVAALAQAAWNQSGWSNAPLRELAPAGGAAGGKRQSHFPADDFYQDWAWISFGPEVADEAARIFAEVDGCLPRPSDWIGGPGGYAPDKTPWEQAKQAYAFVDAFAALRPKVSGAGQLERFDYWLHTFAFLRATAEMRCRWHEFNTALERAQAEQDAAKQQRIAREEALPRRETLIRAVMNVYEHLLAVASTSGELGTVCNLEQHTFPGMIDTPGAALAALLGELPESAQLPRQYGGEPRLVVLTRRTSLEPGEALQVKAVMLDRAPALAATLYWRPLGEGKFQAIPMTGAGRNALAARLDATQIAASGIEYYIEAQAADQTRVRWPATAPALNQTVIPMPE